MKNNYQCNSFDPYPGAEHCQNCGCSFDLHKGVISLGNGVFSYKQPVNNLRLIGDKKITEGNIEDGQSMLVNLNNKKTMCIYRKGSQISIIVPDQVSEVTVYN